MRIKQLLLVVFSCIFCASVSAKQSAYVDFNFGMVNKSQTIKTTAMLSHISTISPTDTFGLLHLDYAWTFGGDLGLTINRYLGVEGGGFWFENGQINAIKGDDSAPAPALMKPGQTVRLRSWLAYLAMKAKAPIIKMVDLYGKVGAGYEHQSVHSSENPQAASKISNYLGKNSHWAPVLSVGLEDQLTKSIHVNLQYMYVAPDWQHFSNVANPDSTHFSAKSIYTLSVGYSFSL